MAHDIYEGRGAFIAELADLAQRETVTRFRSLTAGIENKAREGFDPVTLADREGERVIRTAIANQFPDDAIQGEEFPPRDGDSGYQWIIDPVDGTRAFICGAPTWVTLIALEYKGRPACGLIDQPISGDRWISTGSDARLISKQGVFKCVTSRETDLNAARIATTDPRGTAYFTPGEAEKFDRLANKCRLARFGLDAYAYGLLASGSLEIVAEAGLQYHDYAALSPIVTGAGGVISNWSGEPLGADGRGEVLACANQKLHDAALEWLRRPS